MKEKKIAIAAAETAGDVIMKYYRSKYEITDKSPNNPVTEADLAANYHIHETITSAFPQDGWLSEESKDSPDRVGKIYNKELSKPQVVHVDRLISCIE